MAEGVQRLGVLLVEPAVAELSTLVVAAPTDEVGAPLRMRLDIMHR
jgi:hypothetical protein